MVRKRAEAVCQKRIDIFSVMIVASNAGSRFDAAMMITVMTSKRMKEELSSVM